MSTMPRGGWGGNSVTDREKILYGCCSQMVIPAARRGTRKVAYYEDENGREDIQKVMRGGEGENSTRHVRR